MPNRPKIASQPDELTPDEAVQAALDLDCEHRKWLRRILPLILDMTPPAASPAVEYGRNMVRLAACQRACRILRADQPTADRLAEDKADQIALSFEARE